MRGFYKIVKSFKEWKWYKLKKKEYNLKKVQGFHFYVCLERSERNEVLYEKRKNA